MSQALVRLSVLLSPSVALLAKEWEKWAQESLTASGRMANTEEELSAQPLLGGEAGKTERESQLLKREPFLYEQPSRRERSG